LDGVLQSRRSDRLEPQGLGRLALASEEQAKAHAAHALHLMVRPENAAARRLYERARYTQPARIFLTKELG
jgi:ribosomal protein S18 acetylase RimI-like enzyme